jgi:hypothetical protein
MKKIKITLLLGSALVFTLSPASVMAVDFHSLAELQNAAPSNPKNGLLVAKEVRGECVTAGHSTAGAHNARGFCEDSNPDTPTANAGINSIAKNIPLRIPQQTAQAPVAVGSPLESHDVLSAGAPIGAKCASGGGSDAGATGDAGSFCLASDIKTSATPPANFSVANGLPVEGLQFLQVTFQNGSRLVGSRRLPDTGATVGAKCMSIGGSNAGATGSAGDFCLASDLFTSTTAPANFSMANSLPVASLQFLQVTFRDGNQPHHFPGVSTKCASVSGSTAANGDAGGFCLVSDLSTSATDLANFAVANNLPAAGLQFLQVTFRDGNSIAESSAVTPTGAECVSVDGSTASNGDIGESCVASDLSTLTAGFANFSIANDLPVVGLQFLQVMFGDGSPQNTAGLSQKCASAGGSTSATGDPNGFCLVSERRVSKTNYANFSVANDAPVTDLQFVQVPVRDSNPRGFSSARVPVGVIISDPARLRLPPPIMAGIADHPLRYYDVAQRRSGIKMLLGPRERQHSPPMFWIGSSFGSSSIESD